MGDQRNNNYIPCFALRRRASVGLVKICYRCVGCLVRDGFQRQFGK